MPIQTRSALVAATMTLTLAAGTSVLAPQLVGTALAQASGGGSGGSVGGAGQGAGSGAAQRNGGATDQRSTGAGASGGSSDPMNRNRGSGASGSPMSGSSGTDATRTDTMRDRGGAGTNAAESGLVGTDKLNAALGALEGTTAGTRGRRAASSARVVQMEEYETAMRNALAVEDSAQRSAAISEARERLQRASNRQVPADVIARVDAILGLPATNR